MNFTSLDKTRARNAAKMIRADLGAVDLGAAVELIKHWPKTGVRKGVVAGYLPVGTEIDPRALMGALADAGHDLALPCIVRKNHPLQFRAYRPGDRLRAGPYGTKQPLRDAQILEPDIILLPLLAFDRVGTRLGYGGGYYDRTLAGLEQAKPVFACGLAYSGQEVPILPKGEYDKKLDAILSEKQFRKFEDT